MVRRVVEQHQLAGLDERERGFTRLVEIEQDGARCRALLRYEAAHVITDGSEHAPAALADLVCLLHERGYRQLRTRLSFSGETYLGSQEPWLEYPDPALPGGLVRRLLAWLRR